jgi:single-strand DNA-binding protein
MSVNINKVIMAGNITRDPEVKFLENERCVCSFSLAVNESYKDKNGEKKENVTFIDCEAWGRTAELVGQYLKKGSPCFIEGKLKLEKWDDKDGNKRSKLKVVADSVQFLSSGKKDEAERLPSEDAASKSQRSYESYMPEIGKDGFAVGESPAATTKPRRPAPAPVGDDEPPF